MTNLTNVGRSAINSASHRAAEERRRLAESADVHPDADEEQDGQNDQNGEDDPEPTRDVHGNSMEDPGGSS